LIAQLLLYFRFEISCINSFHAQYYSTLLTLLHLFNCRVNKTQSSTKINKILNLEERRRTTIFVFEKDRKTFQFGRLLLRNVLSLYSSISPKRLQFTRNPYGKPKIANENSLLSFNISHTNHLICCAVVPKLPIGVDVERFRNIDNLIDIANYSFSPYEIRDILNAVSIQEKQKLFFAYWTLREAYLKGRGIGFSDSSEIFSFLRCGPNQKYLQLSINPSLIDSQYAWRFITYELNKYEHMMSIAVKCDYRHGMNILIHDVNIIKRQGELSFIYSKYPKIHFTEFLKMALDPNDWTA